MFGAKAGYVYALPDAQRMRVPVQEDQSLQVVDRNVHRDLGRLTSTSLEGFDHISPRWSVNAAYMGF